MTPHCATRCLLAIAMALASSFATGAVETNDIAAAQAIAESGHRHVLILFTGSDWCPWSAAFKTEITDTPEFKEFARTRLVIVTLDFPKSAPPSGGPAAQMTRFGVRGLPAAVLTDAKGTTRCVLGYEKGGPKAFIARLAAFIPPP